MSQGYSWVDKIMAPLSGGKGVRVEEYNRIYEAVTALGEVNSRTSIALVNSIATMRTRLLEIGQTAARD